MDRSILGDIFAFVSIIVGMGCFTGIVTAYFKMRQRSNSGSGLVLSRLDEIADRLNRMDTAIDTMAVEVERISEGQRFTAKVLAERSVNPVLPEKTKAGAITPH